MNIRSHFSAAERAVFFSLVREEWNEDFGEIEYAFSPQIFLGISGNSVIAGIAVFQKYAPETGIFFDLAESFFAEKKPYLAYFVVAKECRGCGVGSIFFQKFLANLAEQSPWLIIENPELESFYTRFGFVRRAEQSGEIMLVTHPKRDLQIPPQNSVHCL